MSCRHQAMQEKAVGGERRKKDSRVAGLLERE